MSCRGSKVKGECFVGSGLVLTVISAFGYSVQTLLVVKVAHIPLFQICLCRYLILLFLSIPTVLLTRQPFLPERSYWLTLVFRSTFGSLCSFLLFYSIHHMPLGDATVIYMTNPAIVGIMAFFILKERCWIFEIVTTITMMVAVVLIAQPPFIFEQSGTEVPQQVTYGRLVAAAAALGGSVAFAGSAVAIRMLNQAPFSSTLFMHSCCGIVTCALLIYITDRWVVPSVLEDYLYLLGLGSCGFASQSLIFLAMQTENAGAVSIVRTVSILFAYMWQVLLLRQGAPNAFTITGAVLILVNIVAYGVRKMWCQNNKDTEDDEAKPIMAKDEEK